LIGSLCPFCWVTLSPSPFRSSTNSVSQMLFFFPPLHALWNHGRSPLFFFPRSRASFPPSSRKRSHVSARRNKSGSLPFFPPAPTYWPLSSFLRKPSSATSFLPTRIELFFPLCGSIAPFPSLFLLVRFAFFFFQPATFSDRKEYLVLFLLPIGVRTLSLPPI